MIRVLIITTILALTVGFPQNTEEKASATDISAKAASSSYGSGNQNVDVVAAAAALGSNYVTPDEEKRTEDNYGAPAEISEDDKYDNCTYYAKDGYKCVPYYLCSGGYIITDGGGIIDIRFV